LEHFWCTNKPWTHKTHHGPNFLLVVLFVISHGGYIQMSFCPKTPNLGVLKFSKLGFPRFWKPIIFCANLQLKWSLKQSFVLHRDFPKDMWHATSTQVYQGESRFFVVGSQIDALIPDPSFGHNVCFKYSNGMCKCILHIYVPRSF
jgi:hypothetical protein